MSNADEEGDEECSSSSEIGENPFVFVALFGSDVMMKVLHPEEEMLSTASSSQSKKLVAKVIAERSTKKQPNHSDLTLVSLVGRVIPESSLTAPDANPSISVNCDPPFITEDNIYCTIGDSEVIPGLELTIRFMHEGEQAIVR
jgi:hypothetical protein